MGLDWLWRFAGRAAGPRDGQGLALETLDLPSGLPPTPMAPTAIMRRQRDATLKVLSAKLLGAHLANRHQISYPLTIDFRSMQEEERSFLLDVAAAAALSRGEEGALSGASERLSRRGADEAALAHLRASAAAGGPSVNAVVERAKALNRAPHAYAVSLIAAGTRSAAGQLYLTYLAARLGLSQEVVGSVNRRYRG